MRDERLEVGIDAGGTLTKIAYMNNGVLNLQTFPSTEISKIAAWIDKYFPDALVCVTGGKSELIQAFFSRQLNRMIEFDATCSGVKILMQRQGLTTLESSFILTNVGTGTSIHYIEKDQYQRVGGIGVGGGTLMGLAQMITGITGYDEIINKSRQGKRDSIDLKVSDIYEGATPPISGDLTASNFGKAIHPDIKRSFSDILAAIIGLVGETVTTISIQAAAQFKTSTIIYIGSTLLRNDVIIRTITDYTKLRGANPIVLTNGEYCGAIGALYY